MEVQSILFYNFYVKECSVMFQDIELPDVSSVPEEKNLVIRNARLQNYWKSSPYYLEDIVPRKSQSTDIERFSDRVKLRTTLKRDPLEQILRLTSDNFPLELLQGMKGATHNKRKVRWNPESGLMRIEYLDFNFFAYFCILDMQKLELFEKLEKKLEGQDEKGGKERKKVKMRMKMTKEEKKLQKRNSVMMNIDFDDDEDDFNMEDDNDGICTFSLLALVICIWDSQTEVLHKGRHFFSF
ncbi:hypothetical protein CK203_003003 [Vitis vinifera]|uniref:Uncharacterized protein n=1 Tax=Vitis vinifera TaxID=29760 RepID=A0A438K7S3_VITVI|nr:hypothetical protein CK203_003003 [Vitis vinifera]